MSGAMKTRSGLQKLLSGGSSSTTSACLSTMLRCMSMGTSQTANTTDPGLLSNGMSIDASNERKLFHRSITARLRENNKRATGEMKKEAVRFPGVLVGRGMVPDMLLQIPIAPVFRDYKRRRYALQRKGKYKFEGPFYELRIEEGTTDEYGKLLDVSGIPFERIRVQPQNMIVHPISELPVGMSLRYSPEHEAVRVRVPITCINEEKSPGLRDGGWLNRLHWYVDINVAPFTEAPLFATMDMTGLKMKQRRNVGELQFENKGQGCRIALPDETAAVMISPV